MTSIDKKLIAILLALIVLNSWMDAAKADVYKCGSTYSDQPCGQKLTLKDSSSADASLIAYETAMNRIDAERQALRVAEINAKERLAKLELYTAKLQALNSDSIHDHTALGTRLNPVNIKQVQ